MGFDTSQTQITTDSTSTEGDVRPREYFGNLENEDVYSTAKHSQAIRSDSTDEVDIKKLVETPSLSDIRWLYRWYFASTIVDKPIEDAYKNGFEVRYDPTKSVQSALDTYNYIQHRKTAEIKARRDGFALLFKVTRDDTDNLYEELTREKFNGLETIKVLTIDDLSSDEPVELEEQIPTKYRPRRGETLADTIEVRKSGMVISRKINDPEFGNPIGYLLDRSVDNRRESRFVHASRVQHITWRETVDGDYYSDDTGLSHPLATDEWGALGKWEGDSILTPAYHLLKSAFKGSWATMATLFRYSSPLYEVRLPERANEEDLKKARNNFRNLNAKSDAILPFGYELDMHSMDGQLDPEQYFETIIQMICSSVEMTKSVLMGTQTGTVSGSEVDVQSYYNSVEKYQKNKAAHGIRGFVEWLASMDKSVMPNLALAYELEWKPLFQPSALDRNEILSRAMQTVKMGIETVSITHDEGREIMDEALDTAGYTVDLSDSLTEEEVNETLELLVAQQGNAELWPMGEGEALAGNPQMKASGSGMQKGQKTTSSENRVE